MIILNFAKILGYLSSADRFPTIEISLLAKTVLLIIGNSQFSLIYKTAHPRAVVANCFLNVFQASASEIKYCDSVDSVSYSSLYSFSTNSFFRFAFFLG